jgi:hypothetical protein
VEPGRYYRFAATRDLSLCVAEAPGAVYGQSLADLKAERFGDARSLRDAKRVLRAGIDACLDGRSLKSREVMLAMRRRDSVQDRVPMGGRAPVGEREGL